eukprot:1053817-Lingulodinium_polyedra.AAC.1
MHAARVRPPRAFACGVRLCTARRVAFELFARHAFARGRRSRAVNGMRLRAARVCSRPAFAC